MANWKVEGSVKEDDSEGVVEVEVSAARVIVVGAMGMVEVAVTVWVIAWVARERGRRVRSEQPVVVSEKAGMIDVVRKGCNR